MKIWVAVVANDGQMKSFTATSYITADRLAHAEMARIAGQYNIVTEGATNMCAQEYRDVLSENEDLPIDLLLEEHEVEESGQAAA